MKTSDIYEYLNKLGLADQVHLRKGDQIVFYHWNKAMSDLIPSIMLQGNRIEKLYYQRSLMPKVYAFANQTFENDLTTSQEFVRDFRGR